MDDDPAIREHLTEIVTSCPEYDLAGSAPTIARARDLVVRKQPDLVLVDVGLPDGSGVDFIGFVKQQSRARVLMITSFGDRETVVSALEAGADGYLLKDSSPAVILDGIAATLAGGAPISPSAASYLLERLQGDVPQRAQPDNPDAAPLTAREVELLQLFARGMSYKEAARALDISPLTVGNHVKSIYRKLAVHSRGEAVFAAVRQGQLKMG
ncbi:response regulator [Altererythrobacter aestuarii]|uniref:Response regulator n=1 Tax=Alteraurantiacibacter aestuarii TaxID=650004 RepID=A0A844ZP48_9SPHN|nr:response regulator transcription factor [Alteraurantiacibacter aestuarii]MXO87419.1 response regulator [Alteraurantiacibacter aestuarii]